MKVLATAPKKERTLDDQKAKKLQMHEKHEEMAMLLKKACDDELRRCEDHGKMVAVFDWSAKIDAAPHRQTSTTFSCPARIDLLGALYSIPIAPGHRELRYLHAFDTRDIVVKNALRCATGIEQCLEYISKEHKAATGALPTACSIWTDCARNFRNQQAVHLLTSGLGHMGMRDVTLNFFAQYHGKSLVDASFRRARKWVLEYVNASPPVTELKIQKGLKIAYENANMSCGSRHGLLLLQDPSLSALASTESMLRLHGLSSIHSVRRKMRVGDGYPESVLEINSALGQRKKASVRTQPVRKRTSSRISGKQSKYNPENRSNKRPKYDVRQMSKLVGDW